MNGKEFEELVQRLHDDGWKKSGMTYRHEDFHYYKAYERYEDDFGNGHYRYQILVLFYDWRKYGERAYNSANGETSVTVIVMPIDLEDGRADLEMSSFDGITKVERIAKEYYEWVRKNFKCKDRK